MGPCTSQFLHFGFDEKTFSESAEGSHFWNLINCFFCFADSPMYTIKGHARATRRWCLSHSISELLMPPLLLLNKSRAFLVFLVFPRFRVKQTESPERWCPSYTGSHVILSKHKRVNSRGTFFFYKQRDKHQSLDLYHLVLKHTS